MEAAVLLSDKSDATDAVHPRFHLPCEAILATTRDRRLRSIPMKKSEIAVKVFDTLNALPLADVAGGPFAAPVADLAALALVPWFCDASIQWALRLTMPGSPLKKTLLKKVNGSFVSEQNGVVLIGVPGDGIAVRVRLSPRLCTGSCRHNRVGGLRRLAQFVFRHSIEACLQMHLHIGATGRF